MSSYYQERLSGERLRACYEVAQPRVRQYLRAEVAHVAERIRPGDVVLELGCGYGRVMAELAARARVVVGIDTSMASLVMAGEYLRGREECRLACMDAQALAFRDGLFDVVVCIQNGLCAFGVDCQRVVNEAVRVTRPGGRVLLSTYAARFWPDRLEWFERQSAAGLLGEIDREATGDGVIVCKDGFRAGALTAEDFQRLADQAGVSCQIEEVNGSSLFCEMRLP